MDKDEYRAPPASSGPDAPCPEHAVSLARAWSRLSRQLVPLIGEAGPSLTARLLAENAAGGGQQQNQQEHK
jgi:hypothetical protein